MAYRFGKTGSSKSSREQRKVPWWWLWLRRLAKFSLFAIVIGGILLTLLLRPYYKKAEELDLSEVGRLETASILYDRHGERMGEAAWVRIPLASRDVGGEGVGEGEVGARDEAGGGVVVADGRAHEVAMRQVPPERDGGARSGARREGELTPVSEPALPKQPRPQSRLKPGD